MITSVLEAAHRYSSKHRAQLAASEKCGCFYCLNVFVVEQVSEWTDRQDTALCPYCETDAVIGSAAGFPLTRAFLREMRQHWFRCRPRPSGLEFHRHAQQGPLHLMGWLRYQALLARADNDTEYHREEILASRQCGCYWCVSIFPPEAITKWTDEGASGVGQTAVCPCCGECGVLGSADGYPITPGSLWDVRKPFF